MLIISKITDVKPRRANIVFEVSEFKHMRHYIHNQPNEYMRIFDYLKDSHNQRAFDKAYYWVLDSGKGPRCFPYTNLNHVNDAGLSITVLPHRKIRVDNIRRYEHEIPSVTLEILENISGNCIELNPNITRDFVIRVMLRPDKDGDFKKYAWERLASNPALNEEDIAAIHAAAQDKSITERLILGYWANPNLTLDHVKKSGLIKTSEINQFINNQFLWDYNAFKIRYNADCEKRYAQIRESLDNHVLCFNLKRYLDWF